jgi:hypothetical protein
MDDKLSWKLLTKRAQYVIFFAQEEARVLRMFHIGPEHMLLGLLRDDIGGATRVFAKLDVSTMRMRNELLRQIRSGDGSGGPDLKLTAKARRVLEFAYSEAKRLDVNHIGTEHLLLGLVRESEGILRRVFDSFYIDLDKTRIATLDVYDGSNGLDLEGSLDAVFETRLIGQAERISACKKQSYLQKSSSTRRKVRMGDCYNPHRSRRRKLLRNSQPKQGPSNDAHLHAVEATESLSEKNDDGGFVRRFNVFSLIVAVLLHVIVRFKWEPYERLIIYNFGVIHKTNFLKPITQILDIEVQRRRLEGVSTKLVEIDIELTRSMYYSGDHLNIGDYIFADVYAFVLLFVCTWIVLLILFLLICIVVMVVTKTPLKSEESTQSTVFIPPFGFFS